MAVRSGNNDPQMWIDAAKKVNLHPDYRRPFSEWLEETRSFLVCGLSFKLEDYSADVYPLLPSLWHAMEPKEKRLVMTIVERNGGYTPKCLNELYFEAHVPFQEMQKLRLCVSLALENPHHLELGMPEVDTGGKVAPELAAAMAAQLPVTHGLPSFQLKPAGIHGDALFAHMIAFRARHSCETEPSKHLAIDVSPEQKTILAPTIHDLSVQAILKDAGGSGATKKLAQRKLNNSGAITSHCGLQNHPARVSKLLSALELAASLTEISALAKASKEKDKCNAKTNLLDLAPAALVKLNSDKVNGDVSKLTKKEICAVSFRFFGCLVKEDLSKPTLVTGLEGLIAAQAAVLPAAVAAAALAATATIVTAATAAAAAPAAAAADKE